MARDGDAPAADGRPAPLVSVIVATFNSRLTLACALDSVRHQSCHGFRGVGRRRRLHRRQRGRRRSDRRPAVPLDEPGEELGLAGRPEQRRPASCARPVRRLPRARRPLVPVASRDARRHRLERGRLVRARPRGPARARVRRGERPAAPRRDVSRPLRAADQLAGRTIAARAHRALARAPLDRARGGPRRVRSHRRDRGAHRLRAAPDDGEVSLGRCGAPTRRTRRARRSR